MNTESDFQIYAGKGEQISERKLALPRFEKNERLEHPRHYIAEDGLRNAVNVALALRQPLLVTGDPGTGKTQLAYSLAYELEVPTSENPAPLVFRAKTTSTATDLFYRYDALGHFHDAQFQKLIGAGSAVQEEAQSKASLDVEPYISYEALGQAILLSLGEDDPERNLFPQLRGKKPVRSVVLIDEIDKAPRDLPNDILNEIENMTFKVKETGRTFSADPGYKPILVLTSNSEKNLPEPFLRRCIFYHISFPKAEVLKEIVKRRLTLDPEFTEEMLKNAIAHFEEIRAMGLSRPPATAEFLAWLRILEGRKLDVKKLKPGEQLVLAFTYSILAKNREDKERLDSLLIRDRKPS
jgi:MoxR-like ATPase